ncbi:Myb-like DNA-binding domain containing protein [Tritrichomonas foetus]|uniref:Myb-like DNA-binding domain containing protein n=1 Tax=Tritrichomonas foetus TaxID=1144522 RepID=A0A1J4J8N0_9EUKA|nr:Myb-like DNA-binding domain containing protein [Tritrichomonas foetus]|eukprot:OHS93588.1 Myb-like DNA-binding domain containing protein [Tritrichomonas foetus]
MVPPPFRLPSLFVPQMTPAQSVPTVSKNPNLLSKMNYIPNGIISNPMSNSISNISSISNQIPKAISLSNNLTNNLTNNSTNNLSNLSTLTMANLCQIPQPKKASRQKFTPEEDQKLKDLVEELGEANWNEVANRLSTRSARQCRERFKNYLSPSIKNDPWTEEDDNKLKEKFAEYGPKWSLIATFFPSRSDVNIKNHWTRLSNKCTREHDVEAEKRELIQQINLVIENTKRQNAIQQQPQQNNLNEVQNFENTNNVIENGNNAIETLPQSPAMEAELDNDFAGLDWANSDDNCLLFFDDCSFYN